VRKGVRVSRGQHSLHVQRHRAAGVRQLRLRRDAPATAFAASAASAASAPSAQQRTACLALQRAWLLRGAAEARLLQAALCCTAARAAHRAAGSCGAKPATRARMTGCIRSARAGVARRPVDCLVDRRQLTSDESRQHPRTPDDNTRGDNKSGVPFAHAHAVRVQLRL
jgi:hypothetical protein